MNDTIADSNFKVGANNLVPIAGSSSASNLSILSDTIDGGGAGVAGSPSAIWSLVSCSGPGLTVRYDWLKNAPPAAEFYGTDTFAYTIANTDGQVSAPGRPP